MSTATSEALSTMASAPLPSDAALPFMYQIPFIPSQTMSFTETNWDWDWDSTSDDESEYEYEYISEDEGEEPELKKQKIQTLEPTVLIRSVTDTAVEEENARTSSSTSMLPSSVVDVDENMCRHCGGETHAPVDCETLRRWHTTDTTGVVFMPSTLFPAVLHRLVQEVAREWNVPPVVAASLLYDVNWDAGQLTTRSMRNRGTNDVRVERASGVVERGQIHEAAARPFPFLEERTMTCGICMEPDFLEDQIVRMPCRHSYCKECWTGFFTHTIEITDSTANRCLQMRCPDAQCNERVTEEEIRESAPELLSHFQEQQFSSFLTSIGNGPHARLCPGTECNYIAVKSQDRRFGNLNDRALPVSCGGCSTEFCFRCGGAPHASACAILGERPNGGRPNGRQPNDRRPDDELRNDEQPNDEGGHKICPQCHVCIENADHKNCPKCNACIEKNGGCNYMSCRCGHHFCWLCLNESRGHFCGCERGNVAEAIDDGRRYIPELPSVDLEYVYNIMTENTANELHEDVSLMLEKWKEMTHFAHYFARYEAHDQGQRDAASRTTDIAPDIMSGMDADFLGMANEKLVTFRRFLKYSFIVASYLPEDTDKNRLQKDIFQHLQAELERLTEYLHRAIENGPHRGELFNLLGTVERCWTNVWKFMAGGL